MRDIRSLKFVILETIEATRTHAANRYNLLGRDHYPGGIEQSLKARFEPGERALADRAFDELKRDGLIRPTYTNLLNPGDWVEVTDAGRLAIKRRALDELDMALQSIDPQLVEVRGGAWSALASGQPDALRQSAHSGRELIDQTLKTGAPDEMVMKQDWYKSDSRSQSGITRRHRIKYLMIKFRGLTSAGDVKIAERSMDLAIAVDDKLKSLAHARGPVSIDDVRDALVAAETALRRILCGK